MSPISSINLPNPAIICGDFNSRHTLWDSCCNQADARSKIIEAALLSTSVSVINNGIPTHFHTQTNSQSAIDLSICSTEILPDLEWSVADDLHGSDHYPIIIKISNSEPFTPEKKFLEHRADWAKFERETFFTVEHDLVKDTPVDLLVEIFNCHMIKAARKSIPESSGEPRPRRNPWWTQECTDAIGRRKAALRKYQRSSLVTDKISYCRARAVAKRIINSAKKASWQKYISSININTPMSKIWKRIRKIRGKYQNCKPPYLIIDDNHITDKGEVSEIFAGHYESISSNDSYSSRFNRIAKIQEKRVINFDNKQEFSYNSPITALEFNRMLTTAKNSSPGEDRISYNMIRKSHSSCQSFLMKIMNKILSSGVYPSSWKTSTVLSFPKPGKLHTNPENFRPISLTSCVGKLLEKIINVRLNFFLEHNNCLPPNQFGFRKMHSTIDALSKFTSDVSSALNNKRHVICVSFDLRKAYDTTWRYGILMAMHDVGLRGRLPKVIESFLSHREFRTKVGSVTSSWHSLEQGVPQGSVLSCALFSLAINGILGSVPSDVEALLYVDDLIIYCSGNFVPSIERRIQGAIDKINFWADSHGFTFSAAKTQCIQFHHKRNLQPPLKLLLNGRIIPNRDSIKYLGMTIDYRLNWKEHIVTLKVDCMKRLDLLKCLSHSSWGSDSPSMLRIYRAIIRSKMDYGCFIYGSARETTLKLLDPVHNSAIRLCTGAYRSSPVESLYAESGEQSLGKRRLQMLMQYFARTLQLESSAVYPYVDLDNEFSDFRPGHVKTLNENIKAGSLYSRLMYFYYAFLIS